MNNCPIPGCTQSRKGVQLMCRDHWLKVPPDLQREIWNSFRNSRRPGFRKEHLVLTVAAITAVRDQESGPKDEYGPGEFRINCERCGVDIGVALRKTK